MPKVGTAWVEVRGRRGRLKNDMDLAERMVSNSARQMQGILNKISFQRVALGAAAMAAGIGYALNRAIASTSAMEEATNKFSVVFSDQAVKAQEWSQALVDGYAMSARESREFLSSIQDLLVPMGMASDAAGKMSFDVTKLAADIGSFNNRRTADVMNDIQSALTGQYMTMRKYGVVLSATVVEQEALRLGLGKTKDALTVADKAQAAYNLIVQGSQAAIGDMERTSDSYVNTTKRLNAAWEDFSDTLGKRFIGSATAAKAAMAGLLTAATAVLQGTSIEMQLMALEAEHKYLLNYQENKANERLEFRKKAAERVRKFEEDQMREYSTVIGQGGGLFDSPMREPLPVKTDIELRIESIGAQMDALREKWVDELLLDAFDLSTIAAKTGAPLTDSTKDDLKMVDDLLSTYFASIDREGRELSREIERFWTDWNAHIVAEATKADQEMVDAFKATQQALIDMRLTDFFGDLDAEADRLNGLLVVAGENAKKLQALSERTAWAMQENFSNLFFDVFSGELKTMEDYFTAFAKSLLRISTDYGAQIAAQFLFGEQFKGGGFLSDVWSAIKNTQWTSSAKGNAFGSSGVIPFAKGGVVGRPTVFPFAKGIGLMGEAGPEAIMPLKRGPDGRLGVSGSGGLSITLAPVIQISAIDTRSGLEFVRQQSAGIVDVMADQLKHNPSFAKFVRG